VIENLRTPHGAPRFSSPLRNGTPARGAIPTSRAKLPFEKRIPKKIARTRFSAAPAFTCEIDRNRRERLRAGPQPRRATARQAKKAPAAKIHAHTALTNLRQRPAANKK